MSDKGGYKPGELEQEIIKCFEGFIPKDTPARFAKQAAKAMAAIDQAIEMGGVSGLKPEEALHRLLMSLKYGKDMPERGETIH
ncbi:TPA: hypothetical protein NU786_003572 [Enterobacter hormaechei subsp. xiangfangensis]|nr:hypothetical protein [Enterobacter hormaechei subsp. xiangfangensis]HCJ6659453.1 hypothetical protein [Enterobacter hormaechei subsp. xiangfangensis]